MIVLALLVLLVLVDICVLAGWTPDTRDPRFSLWPLDSRTDC
jgi:hypothetical protein